MGNRSWKSPAALAGIICITLLLAGCTVTTPQGDVFVLPELPSSASASSAVAETSSAAPAATEMPVVDVDAIAAEIAAGMMAQPLLAGAPPAVEEKVVAASQEAATMIVASGGTEQNAPAMVASLFNALRESGELCWADKTATWSENYGPDGRTYLGPQRLEISQQQQNVSHLDYYRGPGSATISILVRGGEEAVLLGNGSLWEYPGDRCQGFDFLEDLELYATGPRPEWGHSGLVFTNLSDALNGQPTLNPNGLSAAEIDALRPVLFQENPAQLAAVRAVTGFVPDDREAACKARREDHSPVDGQLWTVSATQGPVVLNFWSNWNGLATAGEAKVQVNSGTSVALRGGGSAFFYPTGCEDVAAEGFAANFNTPWALNGPEMAPYIVLQ